MDNKPECTVPDVSVLEQALVKAIEIAANLDSAILHLLVMRRTLSGDANFQIGGYRIELRGAAEETPTPEPVVVTIDDLLVGDNGVVLSGTVPRDPDCVRCGGRGHIHAPPPDGGYWTCLCCKPSAQNVLEFWARHMNALCPEGTAVRYWTGARAGAGVLSKTRSRWQVLCGHTVVVWVDGHGGCIAESHVEILGGE